MNRNQLFNLWLTQDKATQYLIFINSKILWFNCIRLEFALILN